MVRIKQCGDGDLGKEKALQLMTKEAEFYVASAGKATKTELYAQRDQHVPQTASSH